MNDLAVLENTPAQAKSFLSSLEQKARGISLYVKTEYTEVKCFYQVAISPY